MGKLAVKTTVYSFILSFALLLVFTDRYSTTPDAMGVYSTSVQPYPDYFLTIVRNAMKISFITVLAVLAARVY
ncbi:MULTISPECIES: hypothetical protein [Alteribacter]|uniref:Uncharacterized protein n=1 Tax=Alteribacter keqinensis TaxID=2483800 RepID=A0A3M7TPB4_9BACI|nr:MULTISPECIES: hypothetical protein [Alteribacter]MBM7095240.1 hypothetical protein [Alteribacter salitolerans]RNA66986.1 hypothetical protein EBO34_17485 [Alteribacter keqinensis]